MQGFPSENALSVVGPRPGMELSAVPYTGPRALLESPIMLLASHSSAIYTMKFNPTGIVIASGSYEREIFLCYVHGDCKNFMVLKGHKNVVLDLQWTIGPPLVVNRFDDGIAKLWDMRQTGVIHTFPDKYQITAISFFDASDKIFTSGIDNDVKVWDLRRNEVTMTLQGHQDMITNMQLSQDHSYLITNGMGCKLCIWDMCPYAPQNCCVKILEGGILVDMWTGCIGRASRIIEVADFLG
ncbi:hypothetical protein PVL29_025802 [Vitis rotundifolia]|uniref:Uncharacterized protein n=1 Tax=Vitis rotundifolia TaxID=103349 RepID=A0AA38YKZ7_VITRO|nr:hypothetical protein PVL29_025802 [Vitis rotundifolia]